MRLTASLSEQLLASKEGLCCMGLVNVLRGHIPLQNTELKYAKPRALQNDYAVYFRCYLISTKR